LCFRVLTAKLIFMSTQLAFFIICLCRVSGAINESKVGERDKVVKSSTCGAIWITNWKSPCNSDYGNSGMKAYVSWQSYCIVLVAVVTTNRYENVEFKDINSIHYGEWRITAHTSRQLQLKSLICSETNKFTHSRTKTLDNCILLGSYAASSYNLFPTLRQSLSIPSSRVKILEPWW
jgi:hypothetical protein